MTDIRQTAYLLAKLCKHAYIPFERGREETATLKSILHYEEGIALLDTFNKDGTQAYLANDKSANSMYLVFRGTEFDSLKDLFMNLDSRFYGTVKGKLHRGYNKAWNDVKDAVMETLTALKLLSDSKDWNLYITGHSAGGAIAGCVVEDIWKEIPFLEARIYLYTFGAPKYKSEHIILSEYYNIINAGDPVPLYPPSKDYQQFGNVTYIKGDKLVSGVPFLSRLFCGIKKVFCRKRLIKNHFIDSYIAELKKIASGKIPQEHDLRVNHLNDIKSGGTVNV